MPRGKGIYEDEPREQRKSSDETQQGERDSGPDATPDVPDPKTAGEPTD